MPALEPATTPLPPGFAGLREILEGDRDPSVLCDREGFIWYANPAASRWCEEECLTDCLVEACAHAGTSVQIARGEAMARPLSGFDDLFVVRLHPIVLADHPLDLLRKLQALTSERRMPLEQRLATLLRLGADHFGMDRAVQARVDGRFQVVDRVWDPTGRVSVGDEQRLRDTFCHHTLRARGAFGVADVAQSDFAEQRCATADGVGAYLGAPVFVDAVRIGTLYLASDRPRPRFTESDLVLMGLIAQWVGQELARRQDSERFESAQEELSRLARTDVLTSLPNRRALHEALHWQVAYARRARHELTVVLCDLDHFKSINDTFGHDGGDAALVAFAEVCRRVKRETDLAGRWGGEEFLLVLPDTGLDGARVFCQRLLEAVRALDVRMPNGALAPLRVSMGVARLWATEDEDAAIRRADAALYAAKQRGRDQAVFDEGATPAARIRTLSPPPRP